MRHTPIAIVTLAAACVAFSSCRDNSEQDNSTIAFNTLRGAHTYTLVNSARDYDRDSDLTYYDSACIVMPTVIYNQDITALQDSIMQAAFDTICINHADAMHASFGRSAGELGFELADTTPRPDERFLADGLSLVSGDIFSLSASMLTYRVSRYIYMPVAAHGMNITRYLTYDIDAGCVIDLSYIFTPEGLRELPDVIATKARKMEPQIGATRITALPSDGNFFIDLDGTIVFVYQPYEVASYAQGQIAIPLYPYQLSDFMTDRGLHLFDLSATAD